MISIFRTNPGGGILSEAKLKDMSWLAAANHKSPNIKGPRLVTVVANTTRTVLACWSSGMAVRMLSSLPSGVAPGKLEQRPLPLVARKPGKCG